jgi:hypothetical protein
MTLPPQLVPYLPLLYPLLTAIASIIYSQLDRTSRGHAIFSFVAALGVDIPKILQTMQRTVTPGVPVPTASAQDPILKSTAPPPPPPAPPPPISTTLPTPVDVIVPRLFPGSSPPPRAPSKRLALFGLSPWAWPVFALAACTPTQAKTAVDVTGNICEVVVTAADPALAPLCATAQAVADAVLALVGTPAAGSVGTPAAGSVGTPKLAPGAVYAWLAAHGTPKVAP